MTHVDEKIENKARKNDQNMRPPGSLGGKRRKLILAAFHECIIEQGYAKTTLRDVAKRADMTASHLLYYFPGKDAILEHFFENVSLTIVERLESFASEPSDRQIDLLAELFFAGKGITRSEIGYSLLIGLRTAAYFDRQLKLSRAQRLFRDELTNLAGF